MVLRERGSVVRGLKIVLVILILLGLAALVCYLLSDINRRKYQLRVRQTSIVVERGRFFPVGFQAFFPDDELLRAAYAPIAVPEGEAAPPPRIFEERGELDREIFRLLAQWVRARQDATDAATLALVAGYVERAEMLPGISEEQRQSLRVLRADAAYQRAKSLLNNVGAQLHEAHRAFLDAQLHDGHHAREAETGLREVEQKLQLLGEAVPAIP